MQTCRRGVEGKYVELTLRCGYGKCCLIDQIVMLAATLVGIGYGGGFVVAVFRSLPGAGTCRAVGTITVVVRFELHGVGMRPAIAERAVQIRAGWSRVVGAGEGDIQSAALNS